MKKLRYTTPTGIDVTCTISRAPYRKGLRSLLRELDHHRGIYLSSGYEYPGRYSRWDVASTKPPLEIIAFDRDVEFRPLNLRGQMLVEIFARLLADHPHFEVLEPRAGILYGRLRPLPPLFAEEDRSRQPSAFSVIRRLVEEFRNPLDSRLCLVGAFGYDLLFRFDPIELKLPRTLKKDLHLFLCDDIWFMDRKKEIIERHQYDFDFAEFSTLALERTAERVPPPPARPPEPLTSDHTPEEYMEKVETVRRGMKQGDYFEVVLRQTFRAPYSGKPSTLFERLQHHSPSPYEFFFQFGDEALVGASPEMYVRVEGDRVETSPISGTAKRTGDPLRDADAIRELLSSRKEESELTMCTDVDRNDKSRVCVPGSVQVIARRLIESYAGVFHTVDHVEGKLAPGRDSLDAFLTHMWSVTMIGAPKKAAAQAIENLEKSARGWYAGAVGMISLSGDMNTGILIRTVHLKDGYAYYSAGATLLYDSVPELEHQETLMKATGFLRALSDATGAAVPSPQETAPRDGEGVKLLLVDNEDCFIHTLANYARQTGADVITYRTGFPWELVRSINPDILLISPGPGRPADYGVPQLVLQAAAEGIPVFGVCLGLQGMVEAFGGELGVLDYPMHGKPSLIRHTGKGVFAGLPPTIKVGRYHSLYALPHRLPACLEVTAETEDGVIMGVRHKELPLEAVQFHPESLMSCEGNHGLRIMQNMVRLYGQPRRRIAGGAHGASDSTGQASSPNISSKC